MDISQVHYDSLLQHLRERFRHTPPEGPIAGPTALKDAVAAHLECSQLEAEQIVDSLVVREEATHAAGFDANAIRAGLLAFSGVPGRFQVCAREPLIVVDYAHTPDALDRVLETAHGLATRRSGRLACVFGCGGDRDREKRPLMGAIAERWAAALWLTTDNPRRESPAAIASMVRAGIRGRSEFCEQLDRKRAIESAMDWASRADVIVIAGRGHETQQEMANGAIAFSDQEVVRATLQRRAPS